jgi:YD repeat-containing protein
MTYFTYNTTGSVTRINDPSQAIPQDFFWNEQQQLTGVKNQQGVHHYIYDHSGERIMKSSLINTTVYLNDQVIDNVTNTPLAFNTTLKALLTVSNNLQKEINVPVRLSVTK